MKTIIIYYSFTGNTRKIAKAIHQGVSQLAGQCDIIKFPEVDMSSLHQYDLIGLGCPVWGEIHPRLRQFINNITDLNGKYVFYFFTHATLPEWGYQAIEALEKKGLKIIGVCDWFGSSSLPFNPKPFPTDGHPDDIDLIEAKGFGQEMVKLRLRISREGAGVIPPLPKIPVMPPTNKTPRILPKLNLAKCHYPECHLCMDNCPMDGIDLSRVPVVFAKPCRSCYVCEMICPAGAIEFDYDAKVEPAVRRMKEVYMPHLEELESEGRFRRLIPRESIGWHTPFYKLHDTHPRYNITED